MREKQHLPAELWDMQAQSSEGKMILRQAKATLGQCGIHVVDSPAEIGKKVLEIHNKNS